MNDSSNAASQYSSSSANRRDDYFSPQHLAQLSPDASTKEQREKMIAMEEHKQRFALARDGLVSAIDETGSILTSLRDFNKKRWVVHYPLIDRKVAATPRRRALKRSQSVEPEAAAAAAAEEKHRAQQSSTMTPPRLHRSATEAVTTSSAPTTPARRQSDLISRNTDEPATIAEEGNHAADESVAESLGDESIEDESVAEMSVLRLDLKLGAIGNNPQALVHSLEKSSVAQLLDERMTSSIRQLDNLRTRISDTQSKVLVTGDLNAGKSTLINSLMRRKLMPVDQQPCTTVFCEVLDAEQANDGREELHLIKPGMMYDLQNDHTYVRHSLSDVERIVSEAEDLTPEEAPMIKAYCHDTRSTQESLLRNGIVDIALIDAPGLNRDSLKTTALFARQEQIDVVVFVVSAENHFTLSAKEFLWNASNDKAYIFIVVNKFDQIRNKDKCKRLVLEQIKQLSPRTYEDAEELVHFVDSGSVFGSHDDVEIATPMEGAKISQHDGQELASAMSFARLEACLRDFVLQRREKSKLMPAQTYLLRLLSDMDMLAHTNLGVANAELEDARRLLEEARPALAECKAAHAKIEAELEGEEDTVVSDVNQHTKDNLHTAVDRIGQGKPASSSLSLPPYPGFFSALDYASSVRDVFVQSLELALKEAEQAARTATGEAVVRIKQLGDKHLPSDVERSNRQFRPEVMFAKRLRRQSTAVVGLGLCEKISEARLTDVFDVPHYIHLVTHGDASDDEKDAKKALQRREEELSVVSGVSLGVGALTLLGGKVYGAKSAFDAVINLTNFVSNPTVRKWAPTVVGLATAGFAVYVIQDLPNSIPRNVGRSMKQELNASSKSKAGVSSRSRGQLARSNSSRHQQLSNDDSLTVAMHPDDEGAAGIAPSIGFTDFHEQRMSREVRKVLRLAGWDLQERFRVALAQRRGVVERLEGQEVKSREAIVWFGEASEKVEAVREKVVDVEIAS